MPARTDADAQRARVLDATLALVTSQGHPATTIAAVAREAGLSESFVLWHFRNKDQLLAEALDHSYVRRRAGSPSWSELVQPAQRMLALRHNIDGLSTPRTEGTEYRAFGLMLGLERRPVESAARSRFVGYRSRTLGSITAWWERCLRIDDDTARGRAADLLGRLTLAVVDGRFVNAVETEFDRELTTDLMVEGIESVARRLEQDPTAAWETPADAAQAIASLPEPLTPVGEESSTRTKILRAAEVVAGNVGLDAASISRICKEAACSPTSIYWIFSDKEAIFEALIETLFDSWNQSHPLQISGIDRRWVADPVQHVIAHMLWRYSAAANLMRISLMLFLQDQESHRPIRDRCLRVRDSVRREWANGLAHAVPELAEPAHRTTRDAAAFVTACVLDGLFLDQQISGEPPSLTQHLWSVSEMMRSAVRGAL